MTVIVDPIVIGTIVSKSEAAKINWTQRGRAPIGYLKGMAVMFAWCMKRLDEGNQIAVDMAKAASGDPEHDVLNWYRGIFDKAGMAVDKDGIETLRHLFVLMVGLGMRESSGRYCEGTDVAASGGTKRKSDEIEAGLFQQSWNSWSCSPLIPILAAEYKVTGAGYRAIFAEGVTCTAANLANYGEGAGLTFQKMAKSQPGFAVECAAIALRHLRKHFGPINRYEAEVKTEVNNLLRLVQVASAGKEDTETPGAIDPDDEMAHGTIWLQWALNRLGATPPLQEDGIIGPLTRSMVKRFQEEYDLPATGLPDERTMEVIAEHLENLLHPKPPPPPIAAAPPRQPPSGSLPIEPSTQPRQGVWSFFKKLFG